MLTRIGIGLLAALGLLLGFGAAATLVLAWSIEARCPPRGRFVELPGGQGRLHLIDTGSKADAAASEPVVLLLHGASGSSADPMAAIGDRLARRFRVVAVDRPGQGWSERAAGAETASPALQASLIRQALAKLGISRAIVVGHSWSGALATNLALDAPEFVAGLVLLAPVTHPWPGAGVSWYVKPGASGVLGPLFAHTVALPLGLLALRPAVAGVFAPQAPPPDYFETAQVPLALRPGAFRANAEDLAGLHAFVSAQARRYGEIKVPTTIVAGDADPIVRTDIHSRQLAREVPGTRLIVLSGVGHMPHHAAPDLVVREIEAVADRAGMLARSATLTPGRRGPD